MKQQNFTYVKNSFDPTYAMVDGKLTAVKILSIAFDLQSGGVRYRCSLPDGKEIMLANVLFYSNEDGFRANITVPTITKTTSDILSASGLLFEHIDESDIIRAYTWQFKNGQPVKAQQFPENVIFTTMGRKWEADCLTVSRLYATRKECLQWHDYTVMESDGTERVVKSAIKALLPNEEQTQLVDNLIDAIAKCKDAGIKFAYLSEYDEFTLVT